MKLFLRLIIIGVLTYFLSMMTPWWIVVVIGFVVGWLIPGGVLNSFMSGFLGVGIVWLGHSWKLDVTNDSQFSSMILQIVPLGDTLLLIALVGVIGGLCGGLATLTGALIRKPKKETSAGGYYQ